MFEYLVQSSGCQLAEAELISILWEIINEFSEEIQGAVLRLNHTSITRAILLNNGIDVDKHDEFINIIQESKVLFFIKSVKIKIVFIRPTRNPTGLKI
jgi:ATP phosphoribosyltransferase regulatory subunit HisZ